MTPRKQLRVAIAGGGTGGHIFPGLAIAEGIRSFITTSARFSSVEFVFFGGKFGMENTLVPNAGYRLIPLWIKGFHRTLSFRNILQNLIFPIRVLVANRQARNWLKLFQPHVVIGTGGYASALPIRQAVKLGIPVILQEQNSYPGVVTRRYAAKAKRVFLTYPEAREYLPKSAPGEVVGNPIRPKMRSQDRQVAAEFFGLSPHYTTIFIFGGSQGAHAINLHFKENLHYYLEHFPVQFLWQTGGQDFFRCQQVVAGLERVHTAAFIDEMSMAYSLADVAICRAGAMTLAELTFFGIPAILIPLPGAAANHQEYNARSLEKRGAAKVRLQQELTRENMVNALKDLIMDRDVREAMGRKSLALSQPQATSIIVQTIFDTAWDYVQTNRK